MEQPLRSRVLTWLEQEVPPARVQHILRVEAMAIELAEHHGVDARQAAQAALMHDLAKNFSPKRLLEMAQAQGMELDPVDELNPHLLHADIGAVIARNEFGVQDPEVLGAIANHTLGQPNMSPVSCIVFLADTLEPGRGDTAVLQQLRAMSTQNLLRAVWMTCDYSIQYLLETARLIHPRALQTRNWFLSSDRKRAIPKHG
ncbi:bis(5'-nucleosyl)-tetraphosphatase (symmetrical) YqeK [Leptolyngbya sp. AN02str]|uniref:bis(5'-nucleosyl)-tetraphosphatase (symmetrical) YqeK n=1 Tax=Leptolyngbya sp. AN02str TaxID=3423363 RepID=UPI003D31120E